MIIEAWLLHTIPSGDTSVRLSLFTGEKGIVPCLYKGGRNLKKQRFLQPFTPLWVSLQSKNEWHYVRSVESTCPPFILKPPFLYAAFYLNELLYYALKPLDPCPPLFETYRYTLQALTAVTDRLAMESLLRRFEWQLLTACGYGFSLNNALAAFYNFVPGKGFIAAGEGYLKKDVVAITEGRFDNMESLKAAKVVMRQAITHLLEGREIHSRRFFHAAAK